MTSPKEWRDPPSSCSLQEMENGNFITNDAEMGTRVISRAMARFLLRVLPEALGSARVFMARRIPADSWLREPHYAWFLRCHEYASCKTNAIPALAEAEPTSLYHAFGFFLRELGLDNGDEWLNARTRESQESDKLDRAIVEAAERWKRVKANAQCDDTDRAVAELRLDKAVEAKHAALPANPAPKK